MIARMIHRSALPAVLAVVLVSCTGREGVRYRDGTETVIVPASEVHDGWYFAAGPRVIIEGTINGDLYAAGGTLEISGTVNGDLLVAGGEVNVSGTVSDDIRAAGGTVRIEGKVGKNITVAGGNVSITRKAEVLGGVLAFCGNLQVSGSVGKDLMAFGEFTAVSGNVGGNVTVHGKEFATLPGSKIGGNVKAYLGDESRMKIAEGSVLGKAEFVSSPGRQPATILGYSAGMFWFKILWAVWLFLTGLLLFAAFRKIFVRYATLLRERTVSTILWGIAGLVVLPIIIVILALSIVGIPFAILVFDLCVWTVYLSQLSTGLFVGDLIFRNRESGGFGPFWAFTVGLLIVQAFTFIPYVGWLIIVVGLILGIGAIELLLGEGWKAVRAVHRM
jgi:cytoskeletal protein CcmA (bactofilin family)